MTFYKKKIIFFGYPKIFIAQNYVFHNNAQTKKILSFIRGTFYKKHLSKEGF